MTSFATISANDRLSSDTIYLDYNATSPIDPVVIEAMTTAMRNQFMNPASQHRPGQAARREIEQTRAHIVEMLGGTSTGMETDSLVFTSGGTEANNLAVFGLAEAARESAEGDRSAKGRVLVSAVEHPSIAGLGAALAARRMTLEKIPVDDNGVCRLDELQRLIDDGPAPLVVALMLANNETGVKQPVIEAAQICRAAGVPIHCDAVQVVGKLPVNFRELGVDTMSLTAHKFHGPRGIGGLLVRNGVVVAPSLFGGFQQMAVRPGTEDVALCIGMETALQQFQRDPGRAERMETLRDELESGLLDMRPSLVINGLGAPRMPHVSNVSFPGIDRQAFIMAADFAGLAISTGSACASGSSEPSEILMAMGADPNVVKGSIRISLGATTTAAEIETALVRIASIVDNLSLKVFTKSP